jgi:hypothetical protein
VPDSPLLTPEAWQAAAEVCVQHNQLPLELGALRAFLAAHDPEALARDRLTDGTVQRIVDEAHAKNLGGKHREGFCEACADAYLVAQIAPRPVIDALGLGGDDA